MGFYVPRRGRFASAVAGSADVLVTGDKDLLSLSPAAPLPILNPRAFWELVRRPG
jgi:hypothetical protein